jgi:hypothetical protein
LNFRRRLLKHPGSRDVKSLAASIAHKESFSGDGSVVSYLNNEGDNVFFNDNNGDNRET